MSDSELGRKKAYFKYHNYVDLSDEETELSAQKDVSLERDHSESGVILPAKLVRQSSSFLGPTPKEIQKEFEAHTKERRKINRLTLHDVNAQFREIEKETLPIIFTQLEHSKKVRGVGKSRRTALDSEAEIHHKTSFYKRVGIVPRELKRGKKIQLAKNIKLEPVEKQILAGRIIYFFPNNDISEVRRRRIHKIIQLGAAWVTEWRDDVTHIIVEDVQDSYAHLLRHLRITDIPHIALIKYDPYIPECIQSGRLLDLSAGRFRVHGAPDIYRAKPTQEKLILTDSEASLQVNQSPHQIAAQASYRTESKQTLGSQDTLSLARRSNSSGESIIRDSFATPEDSPRSHTPQTHGDALAEAIREARKVAHLPLDGEEEGDSQFKSSSAQNFRHALKRTDLVETNPKRMANQDAFSCMNPMGSSSSQNPNGRTIEVLQQMSKYYDQMQDQWRTLAYRKAINTLKKQDKKVTTAKEANALPFIGQRLAEKIEEIVITDRLRRLETTKDDTMDQVIRLFIGIYGVGLSQAGKWHQAGFRTLDDLVSEAKLTKPQRIGIEHYDDFATRIPRQEVEAHGQIIMDALHKIDPKFQATIMGSYRRGSKNTGDIDIIITKPGASLSALREAVFGVMIPALFKTSFLKVSLATSSRTDEGTKWHGVSCLPSSEIWRRLDLLLVPECEMGAALIYFTGNDIFNRSMRLLASKKGMRLNQRGLFKNAMRGKDREKLSEGTLIEGKDERRIFEILDVPWREPTERIC